MKESNISNMVQYVGLDVDDKSFHGHVISNGEQSSIEFRTKPNISSLIKKLEKVKKAGYKYKICYEASYLGYSLQRALSKKGYSCEVIAPSLIPQESGRRVKTDRIDSKKLTEYYQKGLLTAVHIPDEEEEKVRDLIRSRKFISNQLKRVKVHVLSNCRRSGLNYRVETNNPRANYWTMPHMVWLKSKLREMEKADILRTNLLLLLNQVESIGQQIELYDEQIRKIAQQQRYEEKVKAIRCYRGLNTLSAMTLIVELGDIRRFGHPSKITSYSGMDISEYSSGGKQKRFGMSKMGNSIIRTTAIEACQNVFKIPKISKQLKERRKEVDVKYLRISDRCMKRLYKKSLRMLNRGKITNKIKAACARELLGFIWESLMAVA